MSDSFSLYIKDHYEINRQGVNNINSLLNLEPEMASILFERELKKALTNAEFINLADDKFKEKLLEYLESILPNNCYTYYHSKNDYFISITKGKLIICPTNSIVKSFDKKYIKLNFEPEIKYLIDTYINFRESINTFVSLFAFLAKYESYISHDEEDTYEVLFTSSNIPSSCWGFKVFDKANQLYSLTFSKRDTKVEAINTEQKELEKLISNYRAYSLFI